MLTFTLAISSLATANLPWFMDLNITGSYAILLFIASEFTSITSHIHDWVLFLLWLHLFFLSGVSAPLISRSIFGTYLPGEFILQCPIFLPFLTVRRILKARILKWFVIPFSSGPRFVRTLHCDLSILGGVPWHGSSFHWDRQGCGPDDHYIYYCGQESLRRNGVAIMVNKRVQNAVLGWMQSQKRQNDLCSFPRQTIQYHSNPNLCPNQ